MSWVNDFNNIQQGETPASKAPGKRKEAAVDKLKAELKLLEWHKLANDAAIKAALSQTKSLKQQSAAVKGQPAYVADDAQWIRRVITNEQTRPLEVSKDFVLRHEAEEVKAAERMQMHVDHHIKNLRSLRTKLEDRAELRSRTSEFRDWKKEFSAKKQAVMSGKTLDDFSRESESRVLDGSRVNASISSTGSKKPGDLSSVLLSLEKLTELERRITSLESDNAYDKMLEVERNPEAATSKNRLVLQFKKKVRSDGPVKRAVYTVREKKKGGWDLPQRRGGPVGTGMNAAKARMQKQHGAGPTRGGAGGAAGGGGGTFLTDVGGGEGVDDNVARRREAARVERLRQMHNAPAGQKQMHVRIQMKKIKVAENALSKRRHEEALSELINRRKQADRKVKPIMPVTRASKGASAGVKTSNRHLQDFQKMKQSFVNKRSTASNPKPAGRPPLPSKGNRSAGGGGGGIAQQSQQRGGGSGGGSSSSYYYDGPETPSGGGGGVGGVGGVSFGAVGNAMNAAKAARQQQHYSK